MSARIRHSSLLLRKYDWIFCECNNTQRPPRRILHATRVLGKDIPSERAPPAEIEKPVSEKPLVRRLQAVLDSILSAKPLLFAELGAAADQGKGGKTAKRKRSRIIRIKRVLTKKGSADEEVPIVKIRSDVSIEQKPFIRPLDVRRDVKSHRGTPAKPFQSKSPAATGVFVSENGIQYRISRAPKRDSEAADKQWQPILQRKPAAEIAKPRPVEKQSQTARFLKASAELATPEKPLNRKQLQLQSLLSKPGSDKHSTIPAIDSTKSEASAKTSSARRRRWDGVSSTVFARAKHKAILEMNIQKEPQSHGSRKVPAEKHRLIRKVTVETSPDDLYAREHVLQKLQVDFSRLEDRHLVRTVERAVRKVGTRPTTVARLRRVKLLKIRRYLTAALRDLPILSKEAYEMAQEVDEAIEQPIVATEPPDVVRTLAPPLRVVKYDSGRIREHAVTSPTFIQPVLIRTNRKGEEERKVKESRSVMENRRLSRAARSRRTAEHIEIRKVKSFSDIRERTAQHSQDQVEVSSAVSFSDFPEGVGQPLVIKGPQSPVVKRVPTSTKESLEPQLGAQESPLIRRYSSSSLYPMPTKDTKALAELMLKRNSVEQDQQPNQTNTDHLNPYERTKQAIESAAAKRLQRESWLTRKGDVRLAISLLFSPRSLAGVSRLRKKYDPDHRERGNFKILQQLEASSYRDYDKMLTQFAESWQPFDLKLNEPVNFMERVIYRVGLRLDFRKLEQLQQNLLRSVKNVLGSGNVSRRNTSNSEALSIMIINGKIKEAEEAIRLMEALKLEHKEGLGHVRVEGLVLHGYSKGGDSLFPPPKEYRFPGAEIRVTRIPAGFNQTVRLNLNNRV